MSLATRFTTVALAALRSSFLSGRDRISVGVLDGRSGGLGFEHLVLPAD